MKKQFFILLFFISSQIFAANKEIKIDLPHLLAPALKVEYESLLNDTTGLGVAGYIALNDDLDTRAYLLAFFRWYFGNEPGSGFFTEAHIGVSGGVYHDDIWYDEKNNYGSIGLGVALGNKYVAKNDVVLDIFIGAGRNISDGAPDFYPRWGLTIGKRF